MKIYKQNGDILELTVSEYKELFEKQSTTLNRPVYNSPEENNWVIHPVTASPTISTTEIPTYTKSPQIKYPDIPGEGYMSTSTK